MRSMSIYASTNGASAERTVYAPTTALQCDSIISSHSAISESLTSYFKPKRLNALCVYLHNRVQVRHIGR